MIHKKTNKALLLLLVVFQISSSFFCKSTKSDKLFSVSGIISDTVARQVLPNAKVLLLRWYKNGIDDITYEEFAAFTDSTGKFIIDVVGDFEYLQLAVQHNDYLPDKWTLEKKQLNNTPFLSLSLNKCSKTSNSAILILDQNKKSDMTTYPRLRIRFYKNNGKLIKKELFGYDLENKTLTNDVKNMDIWIDSSTTNRDDIKITVAKENGLGVLNISDDREAGFNIFMKPVDVKTANLKFQNSSLLAFNTPVILFVNSRSGSCFAKFMKIGILNEIILPSEPGLEITEIELQFNVLIGMNTFNDLYFCSEVDLKSYLLGNIYR